MSRDTRESSARRTFFQRSLPTYIENWPRALCNLSLAQVHLPLGPEQAGFLFYPHDTQGRGGEHSMQGTFERRIDQAIAEFPHGGFVRLGSRSPKDSGVFLEKAGRAETGQDAVAMLLSSERIWEDLQLAQEMAYSPSLFVREWKKIEPAEEFRCFVKDGKLRGISQYHYFQGHVLKDKVEAESMGWAIAHWFRSYFLPVNELPDVVVDVWVHRGAKSLDGAGTWGVRLLELNPFGAWTDPCLFDWRGGGDFDRTFRYFSGPKEITRSEGPWS